MGRQTNIYYYQFYTSVGTVSLVPEAGGRYKVMFEDEHLGSYPSPESAADDVSGGHTNSPSEGIDLGELEIPADLGEWDKTVFANIKRLRPT